MTKYILSFLFFINVHALCIANDSNTRSYINNIKSVEQVKASIRDSLNENCGTGHCWSFNAKRICEMVAALDVKVDYQITVTFSSEKASPEIEISKSDIELMRLIFSQCKPTNYQFWSYGQILYVVYDPSPKIDLKVRKLLNIKSK